MTSLSTRSRSLVGLTLLSLALAACGSEEPGAGTAEPGASAPAGDTPAGDTPADTGAQTGGSGQGELADLVPADIAEDGTITVGTDASYAPNEFFAEDGQTIVGFDIDLFDAVAAKLGLEAEYQNADFGTIIAGVDGGKYEAGVSSFTVNEERMQEVNMISYFNAGTLWAVPAGNPDNVDPESPCGLTVAVQANTVQFQEDLPPKQEACEAEGNPITVQAYEGQDEATAAVVSGKAQAMLADSPVIAYAVEQTNGQLEPVGDIYDAAPYGYVVAKDDVELAEAIEAALESLAEDGTYEAVLEEWGQSSGAIDDFAVNP